MLFVFYIYRCVLFIGLVEEQHAESVPDSAESCSRCSDFNRRLCIRTVVWEVDDGFVALYVSLRKEVNEMKGNRNRYPSDSSPGEGGRGKGRGGEKEEKRGEEKGDCTKMET